MLSTIGLPGTNGFVGEFLVLLGTYRTEPALAIIATSGVVFASVYALRAVQRLLFASLDEPAHGGYRDLHGRQLAVMTVFAVAMLWLGVAPQPMLRRMEIASTALVERVRGRDTRLTDGPAVRKGTTSPVTLGAVAP